MTEAFNVADPVFISYRQLDGTQITNQLTWLLRAAGVPVWRDKDDLPPGDTDDRLAQAIDDGLSGGVLVITPGVVDSRAVKMIEAPGLIDLHRTHPEFALCITNAIETEAGGLDYGAPGRFLDAKPGTLQGVDQKAADRDGLRDLVKRLVWHRIAQHRALVAADDSTFSLSVQTRNVGQVYDRTGGQLDIRLRTSPHEHLPDADGLRDLALTIGLLPDAVTRSGAQRVRVTGGAHLSVAFAIGAALPSSRVGRLDVVDQRGATWSSGDEATVPEPALLHVKDEGAAMLEIGRRPAVAVYLDLAGHPSDAAYERFLDEHGAELTAWQQIVSALPGLLNPLHAAALAGEAAARIRALSTTNSNAPVHLLLRCPFPIAVHVARLTNALRVTAYEWDDSGPESGDDYRPRFVPAMNLRASAPSGVITDVLL